MNATQTPSEGFEHLFGDDHADIVADAPVCIDVDDVSVVFNMASEQLNSLKEYFISLIRRELFFKEFRALNHISFQVRKGEAFGLVGTNGSGKSTMLKVIAGVLEASEGRVAVTGSIAPLIELGAGFDMDLTARENIYLNGALLGYTREFIDSHLDEIVDFAELRDFMDMPLKNYSSGMVARIAFAIATITEPDILIVDETLSVGDFLFQQKCERRIQELVESNNVTVLLVSHSIELVERICDRVCWIEKGQQRMIGPCQEVCDAYKALGSS
ncbi:ABC transporter ATP-binding protein [Caniella muris]|uniref:ABC transporter ATP-binding protein n=1 Tax=Caniella muris TaxID=2941502 RepID=UPI0030844BC0